MKANEKAYPFPFYGSPSISLSMERAFDLGDFTELPGGIVTSCCGQYRKHKTKINAERKKKNKELSFDIHKDM